MKILVLHLLLSVRKIISVQEVSRTLSCVNCKKKVTPVPDDDILDSVINVVQCYCRRHVTFYLVFAYLLQSDANPQEKQLLVLYHQDVQQLREELGLSIDINTAPEKSVKVSILKSEKRSRPPMIN